MAENIPVAPQGRYRQRKKLARSNRKRKPFGLICRRSRRPRRRLSCQLCRRVVWRRRASSTAKHGGCGSRPRPGPPRPVLQRQFPRLHLGRARSGPRPAAMAVAAGPTVSALDTALAIIAAVVGLLAVGTTVYLWMGLPICSNSEGDLPFRLTSNLGTYFSHLCSRKYHQFNAG